MTSTRPRLTLYVDTVSPFAYLAFYILERSPVFSQCDITYVPVFLGGIMKACGNIPPIEIKNKDKWINLERIRWARSFSVPMTESMPEGFPIMTLNIQRVLCALDEDPKKLSTALMAFYQAVWVEHKLVQKPEGLLETLTSVLGEDEAKSVIEKSRSDEMKKRLSANTETALADGCFGLPYFVATNTEGERECFWGVDHLGQVIEHLGLDRPKSGSGGEMVGWRSML